MEQSSRIRVLAIVSISAAIACNALVDAPDPRLRSSAEGVDGGEADEGGPPQDSGADAVDATLGRDAAPAVDGDGGCVPVNANAENCGSCGHSCSGGDCDDAGRCSLSGIKLQPVAVTASSSLAGSAPTNATDGVGSTSWNAGAGGTQWIQLDLGRTVSLLKIRMQVSQLAAGNTIHTVSVGQDPSQLTNVYVLPSATSDGQWLEASGDVGSYKGGNVRYIRITTTKSPSWVAWREIEVYGGLEYFGYYCDACSGHGTGDYIADTTAAGANLVTISTGAQVPTNKLDEARLHGAQAILHVENSLIDGNGGPLGGWLANWQSIVTGIKAGGYEDTIAAFDICDECYTRATPIQPSTVQLIASQIKKDFPTKALAMIESFGFVGLNPSYFSMMDWVGFDCHGPWDNCGNHNMGFYISTLRSWLSPKQRMIAVPWAYRKPHAGDGKAEQYNELIKDNINRWDAEILSDSKYIAVVPFQWQTMDTHEGATGEDSTGAQDMWWVSTRLHQLANHFLPAPTDFHVDPIDFLASSTYSPYYPFAAFDRDDGDMWNSGCSATSSAGPGCGQSQPRYVEAILPGNTRVKSIELTVAQDVAGATTHVLLGKPPNNGAWVQLGVLQGVTQDMQHLKWFAPGCEQTPEASGCGVDLVNIEVDTLASPSWVAWRDIQIYR